MAADKTAGTLNHLIAAAAPPRRSAATRPRRWANPSCSRSRRDTAGLHREIGDALRPHVSGARASPAEGATLAGKFRQLKGGLKASLASDTEAALVPELEDTEQTVVQAFESALGDPLDGAAERLVAEELELLKAHLLFWQNQPPPTPPPA